MSQDPKLPWGIPNQGIKPGSLKTISESKLVTFAVGQQKKSRFQVAREEKEQKRREEEEEAAKVFDSFVASFEVEENGAKTFVRGGKVQSGEGDVTGGKSGELYKLDRRSTSKQPASEMDRMIEEMKSREERVASKSNVSSFGTGLRNESGGDRDRDRDRELERAADRALSAPFGIGGNTGSKLRQIDDFLNEIKVKQENKSSGKLPVSTTVVTGSEVPEVKGSFDDGDPNTTNIYVGNLAPTVTEEHLHELFGRYGDINSIKVMWPRTDEERARKRNCGFVSFMRRPSAEEAMLDLQDYVYEGNKMMLSWGKPVKINSSPFLLPPPQVPLPPVRPPPPPLPPVSAISTPAHALTTPNISTMIKTEGAVASIETNSTNLQQIIGDIQLSSTGSTAVLTQGHTSKTANQDLGNASVVESKSEDHDGYTTVSESIVSHANITSTIASSIAAVPPPPAPPLQGKPGSKWDATPASMVGSAYLTMKETDPRINITPPVDKQMKELIDLMATFVAADGEVFEKTIRAQEESNPQYRFLFDHESPEGQYYRWRTYANLMSDSKWKWREEPFMISIGGTFFVPPICPRRNSRSRSTSRERPSERDDINKRRRGSSRSISPNRDRPRRRDRSPSPEEGRDRRRRRSRSRSDSRSRVRLRQREYENERIKYAGMTGAQIERARDKERESKHKKQSLSADDYDSFYNMLQHLTVSQKDIKAAMGFAYDKVEAAQEIMSMLKESLLIPSTPPAARVARLYLLSDILHNSGAPIKLASYYRIEVQAFLPQLFEELGALRRASGRMTAHQVEERVKQVLAAWDEWSILSPMFLLGLEAAFFDSETRDSLQVEECAAQSTLDGSISSSQMSTDITELETLKRQAKFSGIYAPPDSTVAILKAKLDSYKRYQDNKAQQASSSGYLSAARLAADILGRSSGKDTIAGDSEYNAEDEDIDGAPISMSGPWATLQPLSAIGTVMNVAMDGIEEDDVDGVPMDFTDHLATLVSSSSPIHAPQPVFTNSIQTPNVDDDIDGVPFDDDIDGVPMEL